MSSSISATFDSRRDADMAVERLVQELGIERTDIFIAAEGSDNSVGRDVAGSDAASSAPRETAREDGAHQGAVTVAVDVNDDCDVAKVRAAFDEFNGAMASGG